ncbi:type II secretion system protein [Legionella sp. PATHC035]|uniref:type II secretion system protein n=1 Tax=Legionella sp. PATHC035 TaxID=2992040 RepID=UPI002243D08C|nr:type II secretion system protein [Legionella sp. PATHC035]MCW8407882.1 type II secretion system protein [Legionella sp. PATHC035]
MNQDKGFILLVTMLIMGVIGLLILTSMQHTLMYYKAINKQEVVHQNFYQLEDVALQLLRQYSELPQDCVMHTDSANQVTHRLFHHKGCSLNSGKMQYKYYIEDLGEFPCLRAYYRGRNTATHHQRITIAPVENGTPGSFLQIRFIHRGRIIPCLTKEHSISLGVSSWRYVPAS